MGHFDFEEVVFCRGGNGKMDQWLIIREGIEKLHDAGKWLALSEKFPLGDYFRGPLFGA